MFVPEAGVLDFELYGLDRCVRVGALQKVLIHDVGMPAAVVGAPQGESAVNRPGLVASERLEKRNGCLLRGGPSIGAALSRTQCHVDVRGMPVSHGSLDVDVLDAMYPEDKGRAAVVVDLPHEAQQGEKKFVPEMLLHLVAPIEVQDRSLFVGNIPLVFLGFAIVLVDEGIGTELARDFSREPAGVFVIVTEAVRGNEENPVPALKDFDISADHGKDPEFFTVPPASAVRVFSKEMSAKKLSQDVSVCCELI